MSVECYSLQLSLRESLMNIRVGCCCSDLPTAARLSGCLKPWLLCPNVSTGLHGECDFCLARLPLSPRKGLLE